MRSLSYVFLHARRSLPHRSIFEIDFDYSEPCSLSSAGGPVRILMKRGGFPRLAGRNFNILGSHAVNDDDVLSRSFPHTPEAILPDRQLRLIFQVVALVAVNPDF
jgi:hypothetical protein